MSSTDLSSDDWMPIRQYRDFWDVPRMFVVDTAAGCLLFDSGFDDETEDYSDSYSVFEMPSLADAELSGSWNRLADRALRKIGTLPTSGVEFDPTKRVAVRWSSTRIRLEPIAPRLQSPLPAKELSVEISDGIGRT